MALAADFTTGYLHTLCFLLASLEFVSPDDIEHAIFIRDYGSQREFLAAIAAQRCRRADKYFAMTTDDRYEIDWRDVDT